MTGHIRRRGKNTWAIVVDLGPDPVTEKRRQKWHTVQGSKKDAEAERIKILNSLETGIYVEPGKLMVGEFLEKWLEYAKANVAPTVYQGYQGIVRLHLIPALGRIRLTKLQPLQIQAYYAQALQSGRLDKKQKPTGTGLAAGTVGNHHRVLSQALNRAVKWQLLARNPADAVQPPRVEHKEIRVIDEAAAAWLIDAAIGTRLYVPIVIALTTGMRRGEVLAVRWSDLDLARGFVYVVRALEETKEGGLRFKDVKKKRSRRPISLPAILIEALQAHQQEQARNRQVFGSAYEPNDLVCCKENGGVWRPSAFTSAYRDLLRRRKIANIPFHNLRHSHASQLLRDGVNPKVISERLGHSRVAFTLDVYSHLLPGMQEEAARKTDSRLREALEKQREHHA